MKRKYFSALLMGALTIASVSTFTSCKDYDDDISGLQQRIDDLSKKIDDINTQITNGAILTNVTPTANGVTVSLSNGKTYDITNGKDGKDGTAWTISEDGYWVKDGNKTEYKALGTKGDKGDTGDKGDKGDTSNGGIYYVPNQETGNFDIVDAEGNKKDSGIRWKLSTVTGVMDNNVLTLYGIPNKQGAIDEKGVVINLNARLSGLVFAGDEYNETTKEYTTRYASDAAGLPLLRIGSYFFDAQKLNNENKSNEISVNAGDKKIYNNMSNTDSLSYKTYAYYHVNPSNVNVEDLKKLSYYVQPNNTLETRADAKAEKLAVAAVFDGFDSEKGVVRVLLKPQGKPATGKYISALKLQATLDNNTIVTSDATALQNKNVGKLVLADKKKFAASPSVNYHYRNASVGINQTDANAGINNEATWTTTGTTNVDLELAVGETLDLNNYVGVHEKDGTSCKAFEMNRLGLSVSYSLVKNYKLGTKSETDQAEFISLEGSKITPKVFDTQGNAAIGRTPIIRATLKSEDGKVIEYAYIKVKIVESKLADKDLAITMGDAFKFDCQKAEVSTTVKQMNVDLYNKVGLSYNDFYDAYKTVTTNPTGDEYKTNIGNVTETSETEDGVQTKLLKWTLTAAELWANAGKDIQHVVLYSNGKSTIKLTLKGTVSTEGVLKEKDFGSADVISEYWKNDKAQFNVNVPQQGDKNTTNCTFVNNLNSPFKTTGGKLDLGKKAPYSYYFCKDNNAEKTIGGIKAKFEVSADNLTLKAALWDASKNAYGIAADVLVIDNTTANSVTVQNNTTATTLLNTGALEAEVSVKANACFDATKDVKNDIKVTFNGADHFTALFLRPLNVASKAAGNLVDGVNFGMPGSYIKLKDLVNPTDWRGYQFTGTNDFLWKYYGVTEITPVDENGKVVAECDLNGERQALPSTIELNKSKSTDKFYDAKGKVITNDDLGYLTYKNNGTTVNKAFNIFVKVKVTYKWGVIESSEITVPVKATVGQ